MTRERDNLADHFKRVRDSLRFVNTFGQREQEVAAIIIFDNYRTRRHAAVDPKLFDGDETAYWGFRFLKLRGWVSANGIPTDRFWERCDAADKRDLEKH